MLTRYGVRLLLLALAFPALVSAQSDDEANAGVQFNFSTPGARSLGMGGAFLASVDDASAAYSNPAGILQLSQPEVLVEARRWTYETQFADRGRASGSPTGIGVDVVSGVQLGTSESELQGISYAAFVYPRPTWAMAVYYHRVADFESSFETGGVFSGARRPDTRLFPVQSTYDLEISQAGIVFARQWKSGVAVGIGASAYSLLLDSFTQRYDFASFGPADFSPHLRYNFQTQTGDDQQAGFNVGLLWDRGGPVSTGLVYRFGPKFDTEIVTGSPSPDAPFPQRQEVLFQGVFNVPDVFGGGITFRPSQALSISFDINRVFYSELNEEFVVIFPDVQGQRVQVEDFVLEDATEVHAGLEYLTVGWRFPIALRLGAWYDPDHRMRAETGPELNQVRFFEGEDQYHATAGIGFTAGNVQLDAAADVSDLATTMAVSAAVRF